MKIELARGRSRLRVCILERLIRMVSRMRRHEVLLNMVTNVETEWEVGWNEYGNHWGKNGDETID